MTRQPRGTWALWPRARWRTSFLPHGASFLISVAATFGIGFWVFSGTVVLSRYFVYREPLGITDAARLRRIQVQRAGSGLLQYAPVLSAREVEALRAAHAGGGIEAYELRDARLEWADRRRHVTVSRVTAGFFATLGVRVSVGRALGAETSLESALISDRLWEEVFARSTEAIGATLRVDKIPIVVIGVLPPTFYGLDPEPVDIWVRLAPPSWSSGLQSQEAFALNGIIRLHGEMNGTSSTTQLLHALEGAAHSENRVVDVRLPSLHASRTGGNPLQRAAPFLLTLAGGVLLLAWCTCILVLSGRFHELLPSLRTRAAVGATSTHLAVGVGALPFAVIAVVVTLLIVILPTTLRTFLGETATPPPHLVDPATRLGIIGIAALGGIALSWTCLRAVNGLGAPSPAASPRAMSRNDAGLRRVVAGSYMIVTSALASCLVPAAAGLRRIVSTDPGFTTRQAITFRVDRDTSLAGSSWAQDVSRVLAALLSQPDVVAAAASTGAPFGSVTMAPVLGAHFEEVPAMVYFATGGLPEALGLRTTVGDARDFAAPDGRALLSESLALRLSGTRVGDCIRLLSGRCVLVAAVVRNTSVTWLGDTLQPVAYAPLSSAPRDQRILNFIARTNGELGAARRVELERLVESGFPSAVIQSISFDEAIRRQVAPLRRFAQINVVLFAVAIALTAFGLRAIITLSMKERRSELGIRAALGARPSRLFLNSCRELLWLAVIGSLAGAWLGLLGTRALNAQIGVLPADIPMQLIAGITIPLSLLAAAAWPAWRIVRSQPSMLIARVT